MGEKRESVAPLQKVSLLVTAGGSPDVMDSLSEPQRVSFIFGIGHSGLTPFECAMAGRRVGDMVRLPIQAGSIHEVFGHLGVLFGDLPIGDRPLYLQIRVEALTEAGPREVIRALAEMAACGEHCCGEA